MGSKNDLETKDGAQNPWYFTCQIYNSPMIEIIKNNEIKTKTKEEAMCLTHNSPKYLE